MTLLLVMLHTGTMFAVIVFFWRRWGGTYFKSAPAFKAIAGRVIIATLLTAVVGEVIIKIIEKTVFRDVPHAQIEDLFSHLEFIAPALAAAGILILVAGLIERQKAARAPTETADLTMKQAGLIGAMQGLCLPFRGFSRSGATISAGMLLGVAKARAEDFSFALAVVLTPPVVIREVMRLMKSEQANGTAALGSVAFLTLLGALVAFVAGLLALKWLSRWLETGRWYLFGIYCLVAAVAVAALYRMGY
jgi:undecaprenyl-diphosphatase